MNRYAPNMTAEELEREGLRRHLCKCFVCGAFTHVVVPLTMDARILRGEERSAKCEKCWRTGAYTVTLRNDSTEARVIASDLGPSGRQRPEGIQGGRTIEEWQELFRKAWRNE
jgi:hypothetical protein